MEKQDLAVKFGETIFHLNNDPSFEVFYLVTSQVKIKLFNFKDNKIKNQLYFLIGWLSTFSELLSFSMLSSKELKSIY